MRVITHKDIVKLKNGKLASVFDARNYPKLEVRIYKYPYKSLAYFHTIDAADVEEVKEDFPCIAYPKEWL